MNRPAPARAPAGRWCRRCSHRRCPGPGPPGWDERGDGDACRPTTRTPTRCQVAMYQPDQMVGPPGPEDLPMSGVVAEEPALGEHDRQVRRREQLPPRIAEQRENRPTGGEHEQARGGPSGNQRSHAARDRSDQLRQDTRPRTTQATPRKPRQATTPTTTVSPVRGRRRRRTRSVGRSGRGPGQGPAQRVRVVAAHQPPTKRVLRSMSPSRRGNASGATAWNCVAAMPRPWREWPRSSSTTTMSRTRWSATPSRLRPTSPARPLRVRSRARCSPDRCITAASATGYREAVGVVLEYAGVGAVRPAFRGGTCRLWASLRSMRTPPVFDAMSPPRCLFARDVHGWPGASSEQPGEFHLDALRPRCAE
jgi:hypothetical protein